MSDNWERELITKLAGEALAEQRRARQWKIFFRLLRLLVIIAVVAMIYRGGSGDSVLDGKHTAVIELSGTIDSEADTANRLAEGLQAAYDSPDTQGIVIVANSPGGSPVLSGMAYDEIRRQKTLHPKIPLYTVVEDVCASGCYYIASATDRIYVDKASVVGSIGVLSDGFGFTGTMEKLGIERRLLTAGANKGMGDPFSPQNPRQTEMRQELLNEIHQQFIQAVKDGRGKRLKNDPELFSGRVWLGSGAVKLGLADALGSPGMVAREVIGADKMVDYTPRDELSRRLARYIGVELAGSVRSMMQGRLY